MLRQALPTLPPVQVKCALRAGVLMVLVQQSVPEPLESSEIFAHLEDWLRRSAQHSTAGISAPELSSESRSEFPYFERLPLSQPLPVRLYLRAAAQPKPYAIHQFRLDSQPEHDPAQAASSGDPEKIAPPSGFLLASPDAAALLFDGATNAAEAEPADEAWADGETVPFSLSRMAIALAVGVAVLAFGGSLYALTRPCVLGGCAELQTAEQLHQTLSVQLSQGATLQDVSASYTRLTEASYRLSRVPRWSSHYAAATQVQQQTEATVAVLGQVLSAQAAATEAVEMTQNPPHSLEVWQQALALWEQAIAQLQTVPEDSPAYTLAQQKRLEYTANRNAIEQRIALEQQSQDWVNRARQAVELAEARQGAATSLDARLEAHGTWRTAIALLQQVPDTAMAYAEAQQLLALYQPRLLDSSARLQQEESAVSAHQRALRLADLAAQAEQRGQWSQAVQQWQAALAAAQQVAVGTTVHPQVQPLLSSYRTSLATAQEKLKGAVAAQSAEQDLERNCGGTPRVCTYAQQGTVMQVRITPSYDRVLQEAAAITQSTQDTDPDAAIMAHFNPLLRAIATVGETSQIPIEVYNADGSLFGIYDPTLDGYVSREVLNQQQKRP
ncbi:MAG: hypothetical protein Fur0046_25370 [Cyanobacteria bacterium J069]